jgi:peptidoglycan/xylan/chitin deacetylase (PgdA/CDA1 family)
MIGLRRLKLTVLETADRIGALALVGDSRWRRERLLILCYHGISLVDEHECSDEHVSAEHLRRRFELLRQAGCSVLPLAEAVERLHRRDLPPRAVALTFDDGLYDFKARAYPLLEEFGYHGTVYVATYYSAHPYPVFDVATAYLLWRGRGKTLVLDGLIGEARTVVVPDASSGRDPIAQGIKAYARERQLSAEAKNELLRELCARLEIDWEAFIASRINQLMTPAELRSLDPRIASVQLHTHRHRTPRDERLFCQEIDDNLAALAEIGIPRAGLRHFCYPSGDFDPMFFPWLHSRGVVTATTCETRLAAAATNPLRLPRLIDTMGMPDSEFRAWLTGAADLLPRRGSAVR